MSVTGLSPTNVLRDGVEFVVPADHHLDGLSARDGHRCPEMLFVELADDSLKGSLKVEQGVVQVEHQAVNGEVHWQLSIGRHRPGRLATRTRLPLPANYGTRRALRGKDNSNTPSGPRRISSPCRRTSRPTSISAPVTSAS